MPLRGRLISAENLIEIGSAGPEICWPGKVKSWGVRLFKQARLFGKIRYRQVVSHHRMPSFWGYALITGMTVRSADLQTSDNTEIHNKTDTGTVYSL